MIYFHDSLNGRVVLVGLNYAGGAMGQRSEAVAEFVAPDLDSARQMIVDTQPQTTRSDSGLLLCGKMLEWRKSTPERREGYGRMVSPAPRDEASGGIPGEYAEGVASTYA